ncbi:MAG: two-component system response regulator [Hahellaceae bacterium]|nr:two-component system response regulator [Hahellaceae bacterium]MCP5169112.1 two-component system response regulator [Hahellaceae bacterium]
MPEAGLPSDKQVILVVDDTPENIDVLRGTLREDYKVKAALNGEKALALAFAEPHPDLILLDIMMPGLDGYDVCKALKSNPSTRRIPVIFITAKTAEEDEEKGLSLGAVDYITKPISPPIVQARAKTHLALSNQNRYLEQKVRERTRELHETRLEIIRRLGRAAEFKDNETGLHVIRMSHYSRLIAQSVCTDPQWVELLFNAAPMHDIGKIGIPDRILLKPERLDQDEWEIMKKHPEFGAKIIGEHPSELLRMAREIALTHHEKWDGSGYPNQLTGEQIPLASRIIALADVFDALTTQRPYKKAWPVDEALKYINDKRGQHFDPGLVDILPQILPEILEIKQRYSENKQGT